MRVVSCVWQVDIRVMSSSQSVENSNPRVMGSNQQATSSNSRGFASSKARIARLKV